MLKERNGGGSGGEDLLFIKVNGASFIVTFLVWCSGLDSDDYLDVIKVSTIKAA